MRSDLIFRPTFTFQWYKSEGREDMSTGTIWTWEPAGERGGTIIPMNGGVQLMTREPLSYMDKVLDITDRTGEVVYAVELYVHGVDAQVDPFGRVIGYKNTLRPRKPRDSEGDFLRAINNAGA